jgi:transposase-like protein
VAKTSRNSILGAVLWIIFSNMIKSYKKKCKNCRSQCTKKDWTMRGKQRYKCTECKHVWISKSRSKQKINKEKLYEDRAIHKQTYKELWTTYKISSRTVQKYLDKVWAIKKADIQPREIILLIDTTYFGEIWLMVFKDKTTKKVLHYRIVKYETNEEYKRWVRQLQEEWWIIKAIVCDWRRWLLWGFEDIPTQMCHFHQVQIIKRYITNNPILEANKELKEIVAWLTRTEKEWIRLELERWYKKYESFIKEKAVDSKGKKYYVHRKTRSAYFSLKRNLEYLFVYHDYLDIIDIPNTTNGLEWMFGHLKYKVTLHRWLREDRKLKLILFLLHSR